MWSGRHNRQEAGGFAAIPGVMREADNRQSGTVIEMGPTRALFTAPSDKRTEDYVTGRFG